MEVESVTNVSARAGRVTIARGVPWQRKGQPFVCVEAEGYRDVYWQGVDQGHTHSERIMDCDSPDARTIWGHASFLVSDRPSAAPVRYSAASPTAPRDRQRFRVVRMPAGRSDIRPAALPARTVR